VADFVKQLDRRLGTVVTFARQTPQQPVRLFCQDESRLGLHLPTRRRLTGAGVKPYQVVAPLYEYYWLYGAVEPATGEAFWWEMPQLDAACFTVFLSRFAHQYADSLNLMLLDGAPAHVAKSVQVPDNVVLIPLPAYSPELNPVERLWEDLKSRIDVLDSQVRTSLTALRDHVAGIIRRYTAAAITSLTGYPYLVEVARAL
jgi:DDE superfamily endonuclease